MVSKKLYIAFSVVFLICSIDARVKVFFTPFNDVKKELLYLINSERVAIKFALYYLTEKAVIEALKNAQSRGVKIEAIIDQESFNTGNNGKAQDLVHAGMDIVKFETPGMFRALMHNKFFIFENTQMLGEQGFGSLVWTGSYNCTARANRNCENVLLIDDQDVIDAYKQAFDRLRIYAESGKYLKLFCGSGSALNRR